ncbi:signal peptidase I [Anaeromicropila populeti]|uniref:Signal peptidase I n=1 Tax=Anaeromicropila populeti TaxID=37658 RepID=A0A1I6KWD9_9FIRM|nr:signal peptidase I [Anaeromicropila populeti]SFR95535.1 signal peptidase I [Anaeromicropila populeti]
MEQSNEVMEQNTNKTFENSSKKSREKFLIEIFLWILLFILCAVVVPKYVIQRAMVTGSSMENTLFDGEQLLLDKISYRIGEPKRFDVVVFYPQIDDPEEHFVKRVIGLPGETIQIIGSEIYINGKVLEEQYGKDPIQYAGIAVEPITLGEDEYFLMGDNRTVSYDSRREEIGPVHKEAIDGKAILRIWPLNKFGTF